jgi:serine protease Do
MIIQHDLPLPPEAMGGPVLDINGKAVGINMARVDRVTTYALTANIIQDSLKTLSR